MKWMAAALVLAAGACKGGSSSIAPDASSFDAPPADAQDAGVSPFSFMPASLDFGYDLPGTSSGPQWLTILNNTNNDIADFALSLSGDTTIELGVLQSSCTSTLSHLSDCKIYVAAVPHANGDHTMTITAMAPDQVPASASLHIVGGMAPHDFGPTVGSLDFGTVVVGDTNGLVVTYKNSGSTTLPPASFMFAGESPGEYRLEDDHCTGVQLAAGSTCTVVVRYAPTAWMTPGDAILYGTAANTSELDLRGIASAATTLSVSPASYDFGNVVAPTGSASIPFTVTNTGAVTATGLMATMYNPQFVVTASTCSMPVAPSASCILYVQLVPTATGPDGGGMNVLGANASAAGADFTAVGIPAEGVILDTWSHDFGMATVGTTGSNYTFTVTNVGTMSTPVALSFDDDTAQFTLVQNNCSATPLAAQHTCTFEMEYAPVFAGGNQFARVHVTSSSNDAIGHLLGTAIPAEPPPYVSPGVYDYGSLPIGRFPRVTFTVYNPGTTTKTLTSVSMAGPSAGEFELANDNCTGTALAPSATCTVDVWYEVLTAGMKMATLQVVWATGSASASLSANPFESTDPYITSNPGSFDFGAVAVGQTATFTFPFGNYGANPSSPVTFMMTGINPADFSLTADHCTGLVLANGDMCTVTVVFAPTSTGIKHGELLVNISGGDYTFLTGTGQ